MATVAETSTRFARLPHPDPVADAVRAEVLANPGFGARFTDHMNTFHVRQ